MLIDEQWIRIIWNFNTLELASTLVEFCVIWWALDVNIFANSYTCYSYHIVPSLKQIHFCWLTRGEVVSWQISLGSHEHISSKNVCVCMDSLSVGESHFWVSILLKHSCSKLPVRYQILYIFIISNEMNHLLTNYKLHRLGIKELELLLEC